MPIATIAEILRVHAGERGQAPAMRCGDRAWTYAGLRDESARVAQALLAEELEPQDRVAVLDKNTPEFFTFFFGAAMANVVTLAVNWRLAPREMEYILNHSEARVLLVGREFLGHLEKMKLEGMRRIVVLEGSTGEHVGYEEWIAPYEPVDPQVATGPEDTCCQLYTSGTTGLPKGVELTNRNLITSMDVGAASWSFDSDSVNLVAMPLFHISGSGWAIAGFCSGGVNILLREVNPAEILQTIATYRVTNALFVPAVLQILLATPGVEDTDFSSLRSVVYGASPITQDILVRGLETLGCGFVQVYGLTETTGAITELAAKDHDPGGSRSRLLRSAGRPWGDVEIRIVDESTGRDVPTGEVGEIWSRTAQNMKGYWRDPDATREAFPEGRAADGLGWFRSGDAGYLEDGYLFIHDRVKDMIVSGAENIYPAEIENVLMSHPGVADVAVIGVPSKKWGEAVKAMIVPAASSGATDEELSDYCRERLAHYKCPSSFDRVETLPRNPSGKLLKTVLREPYWAGHSRRVN